jgi:hypothetical protein
MTKTEDNPMINSDLKRSSRRADRSARSNAPEVQATLLGIPEGSFALLLCGFSHPDRGLAYRAVGIRG